MDFAYGALIGIADLVDIMPMSEELERNPWAFGEYCWKLTNPRMFSQPILAKGKLNLYKLPDDLSDHVRVQLKRATTAKRDAAASAWIAAMTQPAEDRPIALLTRYSNLGDQISALRIGNRLVAEQGSADAYYYRCLAYCTGDAPDLDRALDDVNHALSINATDADALLLRAEVYEALAGRDREQAATIGPQAGNEHVNNEDADDVDAADEDTDDTREATAPPTLVPSSSRPAEPASGNRAGSLTFSDLLDADVARIGDELELIYRSPKGAFPGKVVARLAAANRNGLLLLDGAGVEIEKPSSPSGLIAALLAAHGFPATAINGNLFWRFLTGTSKGKTLWEVYQGLRSR